MKSRRILKVIPLLALAIVAIAAVVVADAPAQQSQGKTAAKRGSRAVKALSRQLASERAARQALDRKVAQLEAKLASLSSTAGPAGAGGSAGPQGPTGPQGPAGIDAPVFELGTIEVSPDTGGQWNQGAVTSDCPKVDQIAIAGWGYAGNDDGSGGGALNTMVGYNTSFPSGPPRIGQFVVGGLGHIVAGAAICVDASLTSGF